MKHISGSFVVTGIDLVNGSEFSSALSTLSRAVMAFCI